MPRLEWNGERGGLEWGLATRKTKEAVVTNYGLAIAGGEIQGGITTQGPNLNEFIHYSFTEEFSIHSCSIKTCFWK